MFIDILNLSATLMLAGATIFIAVKANNIADQSNKISAQNVQLEAEKYVLEWAGRCLRAFSGAVALRLVSDDQIDINEFRRQRMALRSELFSLEAEGKLFFGNESNRLHPLLNSILDVCDCLNGGSFRMPEKDDYQIKRQPQVNRIRKNTHEFVETMASCLGEEWLRFREQGEFNVATSPPSSSSGLSFELSVNENERL